MEISKGKEVMEYLRPNGGWVIYGEDFESIVYVNCEPISKKEFEDCLANIENIVKAKETALADQKSEILQRLGISADEAKIILN